MWEECLLLGEWGRGVRDRGRVLLEQGGMLLGSGAVGGVVGYGCVLWRCHRLAQVRMQQQGCGLLDPWACAAAGGGGRRLVRWLRFVGGCTLMCPGFVG